MPWLQGGSPTACMCLCTRECPPCCCAPQNLLKNSKHGAIECVQCHRLYCRVMIRKQLLVCSQMRAAYAASGHLCHCHLQARGVCPCQACTKRQRRAALKREREEGTSAMHMPVVSRKAKRVALPDHVHNSASLGVDEVSPCDLGASQHGWRLS